MYTTLSTSHISACHVLVLLLTAPMYTTLSTTQISAFFLCCYCLCKISYIQPPKDLVTVAHHMVLVEDPAILSFRLGNSSPWWQSPQTKLHNWAWVVVRIVNIIIGTLVWACSVLTRLTTSCCCLTGSRNGGSMDVQRNICSLLASSTKVFMGGSIICKFMCRWGGGGTEK